MTTGLTLLTVAFSAAPIILLGMGDPKRRRAAGAASSGIVTGLRRLLTAIAIVPGIVCAASGDSAAFLMWLGGCALVGWAAAFCLRAGGQAGVITP